MTALLTSSISAALPLIILASLLMLACAVTLFVLVQQVVPAPVVVHKAKNNTDMPTGAYCHERR